MITFKRGLVEDKIDVSAKDFFKFYDDNTIKKHKVNYQTFRKVVKMFNEALINEIIIKAYDFKMPYSLGRLCIRKNKIKNKIVDGKVIIKQPIDWKATKTLWDEDEEARIAKKLVRIDNSHSDNYIARISYKTDIARSINCRAYRFRAIRSNKILLSKVIKDENINVDYYEN